MTTQDYYAIEPDAECYLAARYRRRPRPLGTKGAIVRLTLGMLDAMLTALCELEAGYGPQGFADEPEKANRIMENCLKAQAWIHHEFKRRQAQAEKHQRSNDHGRTTETTRSARR